LERIGWGFHIEFGVFPKVAAGSISNPDSEAHLIGPIGPVICPVSQRHQIESLRPRVDRDLRSAQRQQRFPAGGRRPSPPNRSRQAGIVRWEFPSYSQSVFRILSCARPSDNATFRNGIPTLGPWGGSNVAYEINQSFQLLDPFDQVAANYDLPLRDSDGPHRSADAGIGRHHSVSYSASECSSVISAIAFLAILT
jgi:hypothetical protein